MAVARRLLTALLTMASAALAQAEPPKYEMTTYQLVFFRKPAHYEAVGQEHADAVLAHSEFMRKLADAGTALIWGPLPDSRSWHGVVVLTVDTPEKAREILAEDPWVRRGGLDLEIHTWWAAKDILEPGEDGDRKDAYLGLFLRPSDAPAFGDEELETLQRDHIANIEAMADEGALVIAGPIAGDGRLRGILVFRETDPDRIRELVARDPMVQRRRLELELHRWLVPASSF
jgi:uncharacterized protein YciI